MSDIPKFGDGEGPENGLEDESNLIEAFSRIRDMEKRRILLELVRAMADEQPETDGAG